MHPSVTVTTLSVVGEKRSSGYAYTVVAQLREAAGAPATITSVDLIFTDTATIVSSHHERPISPGTNLCPANGTIATRQLVTVDADASHPYATAVSAKVTFTDGPSFVATVDASAPVPPLSAPVPVTYTLTGVITDVSTHAGIAGARVEVLTGPHAGTTATADRSGSYVLSNLVAGSFRLRASADNYSSGEQGVTVPDNPRADFELRHVTYTLTGVITDSGTQAAIAGARVEAMNGPNVGKAATTDTAGRYTMTDLAVGTSRMRASADGYDSGEQNVTTPDTPRADFELRRTGCAYSISPAGMITVGPYAGQSILTITRTSGTCGWEATDNWPWVTLSTTSGSGDAIVPFRWQTNAGYTTVTSTITIRWAGGSAQLVVQEVGQPCVAEITVDGRSNIDAPAAGGTYSALLDYRLGGPRSACSPWTASYSEGLLVRPASGFGFPATLTVTVAPNPGEEPRALIVTIRFVRDSVFLRIYQAGAP